LRLTQGLRDRIIDIGDVTSYVRRYGYPGAPEDVEAVVSWLCRNPLLDVEWRPDEVASAGTSERERRPEQRAFRELLMRAYGGRCAISECSEEAVLEAAHLPGRDWRRHNLASDGILLRMDLHRLLDRGLLTILPAPDYRVRVFARDPEFTRFDGARLRLPRLRSDWPRTA
jgi:hypothetical protein